MLLIELRPQRRLFGFISKINRDGLQIRRIHRWCTAILCGHRRPHQVDEILSVLIVRMDLQDDVILLQHLLMDIRKHLEDIPGIRTVSGDFPEATVRPEHVSVLIDHTVWHRHLIEDRRMHLTGADRIGLQCALQLRLPCEIEHQCERRYDQNKWQKNQRAAWFCQPENDISKQQDGDDCEWPGQIYIDDTLCFFLHHKLSLKRRHKNSHTIIA